MKQLYLFLVILLLTVTTNLYGQEQFQLTQFNNSAHAINPAFTGIEDRINAAVGFRKQWSGLNDSPLYYYAGMSGTINAFKTRYTRKPSLRLSVPRYFNKLDQEIGTYKHGVGFYVSGDHFGAFDQYSTYFSYAFIYNISKRHKLSFGASANLDFQQFNRNEISLYSADQDQVYQSYLQDHRSRFEGHLNFGIALTGARLFAGYSLHQGISLRSRISINADIDPGNYHHLMAGYNLPISQDLVFQPSVYLRYNRVNPYSLNMMARIRYQEQFWGGIGYRQDQSVAFLLGFSVQEEFRISYSYDFPTQGPGIYFQGSHEFTLGLSLYRDKISGDFLW